MQHLETLLAAVPEAAKDLRLNLTSVLQGQTLTRGQTWGVALSAAYFTRHAELSTAMTADARAEVDEKVVDDARAAAALMGMNTVYYRFRHLVGKDDYNRRPARLRMQRMATPLTSRVDFELMALGCAALGGCETCIKSHEASVLKGDLSEEHVHDAVRIASVVHGVAVALGLPT